jgi:hypothetical protein
LTASPVVTTKPANYDEILRDFITRKQQGAERFASACGSAIGIIKAAAIPGGGAPGSHSGGDIVDSLRLPDYHWPS